MFYFFTIRTFITFLDNNYFYLSIKTVIFIFSKKNALALPNLLRPAVTGRFRNSVLNNYFLFPVLESSHLPHHVYFDGNFTAISKRHSRHTSHRRFLDISSIRPLRWTPFRSQVAALHYPSIHLLHVQHLLRRSSGEHYDIFLASCGIGSEAVLFQYHNTPLSTNTFLLYHCKQIL